MKSILLAAAIPLMFLLVPHSAFAWDWGSPLFGLGLGKPYNNGYQGFHHWSLNNYGQGLGESGLGCYASCQGQRDAIYDHDNNLVYNPYPQCCHSEYFRQAFHEGYDNQWNTYQSQEQNSNQHTNIYINNSPGAYVNTEQTSGQNQEQEPSLSPQCEQYLRSDNTNGDCSNGCPWGQGP